MKGAIIGDIIGSRFEWENIKTKDFELFVEGASDFTDDSVLTLANAQCGYSQTPAGYVWHHVEDMKTMILVPQDLHSVAMGGMSHTGGASLVRAFLGL